MRKTPIQLRIEGAISNGKSYQMVPYTKLLGNRLALKQWLLFSKVRCVNLYNPISSKEDKTRLSEYVLAMHKKIASEIVIEHVYAYMLTLQKFRKIEGLESRFA